MGEVVPACTSPIPFHCASIVATNTVRAKVNGCCLFLQGQTVAVKAIPHIKHVDLSNKKFLTEMIMVIQFLFLTYWVMKNVVIFLPSPDCAFLRFCLSAKATCIFLWGTHCTYSPWEAR